MNKIGIAKQALLDAVVKAGSQRQLGELAGVNQSCVSKWGRIPAEYPKNYVREILLNAPDGMFTARELRPDLAQMYSFCSGNT